MKNDGSELTKDGLGSGVRRDAATTAEKLRGEAVRLFWEKGYSATTTREIAESLGVQRASLYYHIKSKEDLLYYICVESLDNIHAAVSEAISSERDPLDRVRAMIDAHVRSMLADREKHATMLTELKSLSEDRRVEIIQLRDKYEGLVRGVISDAQGAGLMWQGASAKELELSLLNLLNWTIFWYQPGGDLSPERLSKLFQEIYLKGILRP